ncbi:hypothetical protein ACFFIY_05710 [Bhargavaea ullalensis]|uniref:Energy-coupling factor transporter transmembrane protein EcfT n=1 Tax=Bhargavaea ullalensis TaxID=1265685 RepID=A0ABV2GCL6_9BACL
MNKGGWTGLLLRIRFHADQLRLAGYAVLLEVFVLMGDVTVFLAFPELIVFALLGGLAVVFRKRLSAWVMRTPVLLTAVLVLFSVCLYMQDFGWIQPY